MEEFLQQLINGLAVGGIYALIALGYTMVYGVLKLINFAHGDLFTMGAYFGLTLLVSTGLGDILPQPWGILLVAAMVMGFTALVGCLLERVAYRPLRNSDRLCAVVSALGASIFFQNAIMLIYGSDSQVYTISLSELSIPFMGINISASSIIMISTSLLLMYLLYWFINRTRMGMAIRAVATDQSAAKLMGIDVNRIIALVFVIGPALGGVAGMTVGLCYGKIDYNMGWTYGLKAFTAAILGGIGNIPGAMLGGILLGVIESLGEAYISGAW